MHDTRRGVDWRKTWASHGLGPAINPAPQIVFQAAQLLYGHGERLAAEAAFREVLERAPDHLPTLRWLTGLLQNRGQFAEAHAYRQRVWELEAQPGPTGVDGSEEPRPQQPDSTAPAPPSP